LIDRVKFLNLYIDLLTKELGKDVILDAVLEKWEIHRIYNTLKKELIESRKKKSRNALSRTNRRLILKALDKDHCQYCGAEVDYFEVDHITPIEELGADTLENLTVACHKCNRLKGDRPKEETRKDVIARRKEFLWERTCLLFETKVGRAILKRFLLENPIE
jgi:5-methylcytosine-specific restriction endonuclease McrA